MVGYILLIGMFEYLSDDEMCNLEQTPLERLIKDNELSLYVYDGFWKHVDSDREIAQLRKNVHVLNKHR